ncbi:MAG: hypothetical protein ACI8PZ_006269 [Myxococcota bacterium]|jgi:hypothetical protein
MPRALFALSLVACGLPSAPAPLDHGSDALDATLAPPADGLGLDGGELDPGLTTLFTVTGAVPGVRVLLVVGPDGLGAGPCLPDVCLDVLAPIVVAASAVADASGPAYLSLTVPPHIAPDRVVGLQAAQRDGESTLLSEAVGRTIGGAPGPVDADGDGYLSDEDCDDGDASVHPGALELCDGMDTDCDPGTDEAERIIVDRAGEFANLHDAVAAAPDHGLVELCDGTFPVTDVRIDRPVTIRGAGPDRTVLDSPEEGTIVEIVEADDVDLWGRGVDERRLGDLRQRHHAPQRSRGRRRRVHGGIAVSRHGGQRRVGLRVRPWDRQHA